MNNIYQNLKIVDIVRIKRSWIIFPVLLMFLSCQKRMTDRYSEDQIVNIMLDAHTLGLIYNRQITKDDSLKSEYFDILHKRYGLDQKGFQSLLEDLMRHSDMYDRVYKKLNDRVDLMERLERENQ